MTHDPNPPRRAHPSRPAMRVDPSVERQIDENLRKLYSEALQEDLPEQLRALVAKLREDGAQG